MLQYGRVEGDWGGGLINTKTNNGSIPPPQVIVTKVKELKVVLYFLYFFILYVECTHKNMTYNRIKWIAQNFICQGHDSDINGVTWLPQLHVQ